MYKICENQVRPDGVVNYMEDVYRNSFASAESYFHDRISRMYMTELYTRVYIIILDDQLQQVDYADVPTQYKPAE